jgi:hypothetical protein
MNVRELVNKWVILGALALTGVLLLITAAAIGLTSARRTSDVGFVPADVTVIPAPTGTSGAPPTPTIDPFASPTSPSGIAIGNYVQITGTEGQGLRIRAEPVAVSFNFSPMIPKYFRPGWSARSGWICVVVSGRTL